MLYLQKKVFECGTSTNCYQKAQVLDAFYVSLNDTTFPQTPAGAVRMVCISDTHNNHRGIPIAEISKQLGARDNGRSCPHILVHAGDFTDYGSWGEVVDFCDWLDELVCGFCCSSCQCNTNNDVI